MLMQLVAIAVLKRRWHNSLPKAGIDPRDAAVEILMLLLRKLPTMNVRVADDPSKPQKEKVLALLGCMYVSAYRRVMTLVQERTRVRERNATDRISSAKVSRTFEETIATPQAVDRQLQSHVLLAATLHGGEDAICRDVPGDINSIVVAYRYLCRLLLRSQGVWTAYTKLPRRLQERISPEQHAILASRLFRLIRQTAAQL
jgi:hypothetical protein